jgi:hypothetical protein
MKAEHGSILGSLVVEAIRLGADVLEVEYRQGYEEVSAMKEGVGFGIARLRSSGPDAAMLRDELDRVVRRKREIMVGEIRYALRGRVYESFGENMFEVKLQRT